MTKLMQKYFQFFQKSVIISELTLKYMEHALKVQNLRKFYKKGQVLAVDDVSFNVNDGEIFGILGPNGAGKTTTLEMIEGLRSIDEGSIEIAGIEITKESRNLVQEKIGVQLQSSSYFDLLKLGEILTLFGSFYKKSLHPETL